MNAELARNIVERDGDGYRVTLAPQFREPSGWRWGTFRNAAGAAIRHGAIDPAGPAHATIVGVPGFGGFAEQWFDSAQDYQAVYGRKDRPTRGDTLRHTSRFERVVVEEHEINL